MPRVARAVQLQSFQHCLAAELVPCGAASALVRPAATPLSASKMDRADYCAHYEASADRESLSSAPLPSLALQAQGHWRLACARATAGRSPATPAAQHTHTQHIHAAIRVSSFHNRHNGISKHIAMSRSHAHAFACGPSATLSAFGSPRITYTSRQPRCAARTRSLLLRPLVAPRFDPRSLRALLLELLAVLLPWVWMRRVVSTVRLMWLAPNRGGSAVASPDSWRLLILLLLRETLPANGSVCKSANCVDDCAVSGADACCPCDNCDACSRGAALRFSARAARSALRICSTRSLARG